MCGLAGYYGLRAIPVKKREILIRSLMRSMQVRGTHSFGMIFNDRGKSKMYKKMGEFSEFADTTKMIKKMSNSDYFLGHTRQASIGVHALRNAHPFKFGEWYGAHNGHIRDTQMLIYASDYTPLGETDSEEAMGYVVTEEFSKKSLEELKGWFAFSFIKEGAKELNLISDVSGNMHICRDKNSGAVIWASVGDPIIKAMKEADIDGTDWLIRKIVKERVTFPGNKIMDIGYKSTVGTHPRYPNGSIGDVTHHDDSWMGSHSSHTLPGRTDKDIQDEMDIQEEDAELEDERANQLALFNANGGNDDTPPTGD